MTTAFLAPVAAFGGAFGTTMVILGCVVAAALFGWLCAAIAKSAGYSGTAFFILGFFTGIIGVIITTIMYYLARHRNAVQRAAQREAAGPIPLGNVYTAEDNQLLPQQQPEQPPQGQPFSQQPAVASPGSDSPPAGASAPCPNCGAPVRAGASPCPSCGTNLNWPEPAPPSGKWK